MYKIFALILLILLVINLIGFEITGNPKNWQKEDFLNFDIVGDCEEEFGDMTSVFARIEDQDLFLRITFDDMIVRQDNRILQDNFEGQNVFLHLNIFNQKTNNSPILTSLKIDQLSQRENDIYYLRTLENNLLEIQTSLSEKYDLHDFVFILTIMLDGRIADKFRGEFTSDRRGGNAAFVHHGNQGLTYTEVFYGQFPQNTSGFDEVLEVHQATGIPGNFHMSGTLMPAAAWHNPEFNDWLISGINDGYVAMLSSALGQHIMPFVNDDMNNWSVHVENDMVEYRYNYIPKVAWIPERVWLSQGHYPDAGVCDPWLGDNWEQHGIEAIILDDSPHCDGVSNQKIHWMDNGSEVNLRVIPIDNTFVGQMHYDADGAKNHINNTGQYGICTYGTDWEVAAEMNEHHETMFLDNYENVLWYCFDNYPAINVWKLDSALNNPDFNGSTFDITTGTYYLLGGYDGYGGGNNNWYTHWASEPSHSDYHDPAWNYGYIWNNAYENLMTCPDNNLSQLGWYTMMINLHETGWHDGEEISGWEHRYSAHIKNANVYAEASRWANGDFTETTAAYPDDIDRDGVEEIVMHNDKTFFVFESIGGKANWAFAKDEFGNMYSVVGSDVAYWSDTDGDYNEGSNNHVAALSDVSPNYQHDIYEMNIVQGTGDEVEIELVRNELTKTCKLQTGDSYLEVDYSNPNSVFVQSGWTPDLLDLIWNGKTNIQRMWGEDGSYCGKRNSSSGATAAYVLGEGGGVFNTEFEGTLVLGDEIFGDSNFKVYLYAGYTSPPYDQYNNKVVELDELAAQIGDDIPPAVFGNFSFLVADNKLQLTFTEPVTPISAENLNNYDFQNFNGNYSLESVVLSHTQKVTLTINETFLEDDLGRIFVTDVHDLNGNIIDPANSNAEVMEIIMPHLVGTFNNWDTSNHDYELILQDNGLWTLTTELSAGTHEYKVLESDDWDGHDYPGNNQIFTLSQAEDVTFFVNCGVVVSYNMNDQYVFHSPNPPVVCGSFLSELGGTDWNVQTTLTQMNDNGTNGDAVSDDGLYTFQADIPQGNYEYKIVLNNNWDQNTIEGNIPLNLASNSNVTFFYNMVENIISMDIQTAVDDENIQPSIDDIQLDVYPNPFSSQTTIQFTTENTEKNTEIEIYNIKGQKVKSLECINHVDAKATQSLHTITWNGTDESNKPVSSGIYFINLHYGKDNLIKKAVLMR